MKITIYQMLKKIRFYQIEKSLLKFYPKEVSKLKEYQKLYSLLSHQTPVEKNMKIKVCSLQDHEGYRYYEVVGIEPNGKVHFNLHFCSWEEWLSFQIDEQTIEDFTSAEVLALVFFEMTFHGFHENEIKEKIISPLLQESKIR